jgi:hypothetical protein
LSLLLLSIKQSSVSIWVFWDLGGVGEERNLIQELLKSSRQYNGLCTFLLDVLENFQ